MIEVSLAILTAILFLAGAGPLDAAPCPGLIEQLEKHFAQGATRWNPDPWTYSYESPPPWTEVKDLKVDVTGLSFQAPLPRREVGVWQDLNIAAGQCSLVVQREFYVGPDTLFATLARVPEACSEAPALLWRGPDHRPMRRPIPPLFNWNIAAIWCTEHYLVFGLEADYELSLDAMESADPVDPDAWDQHAECVAFWHLPSGNVQIALQNTRSDDGKIIRPPVRLPREFPDWKTAAVAESGDGIVFRGKENTMIFLPATQELARIGLD